MQLKHRHVVSNFLMKEGEGGVSIALFRRSDQVRTYPQKLAPISGTIEVGERPFDAAIREIEEETGQVVSRDIELHLCGKPFTLKDQSIGRSWTIHPFAWRLVSETEFRIDWEHVGWQWTKPRDILDGRVEADSVPNLAKSLERVWLTDGALFEGWQTGYTPAEKVLSKALALLKGDHTSGAGWMATLAVQYFRDVVAAFEPHTDVQRYWYQLRIVAWHIINNGRPSMNAAIERALTSVLKRIQPFHDKRRIMAEIEECLEVRRATTQKISSSFVTYIAEHFGARRRTATHGRPAKISILTLSASITKSAILAVLRQLPDVEIDLRILESRPLCEGAQMASKLLQSINKLEEERLQVTIATDASAAILARDTDLVLLGADRISADGDVSNKTGSFAAALCARAVGNKSLDTATPKVVILSGTEKVAKPGALDEHVEEENASWQVWRIFDIAGCKQEVALQHNKRVVFRNVFFEWVPAEYIDLYLTEHGAMSTEQIQEQSLRIQALEAEIFDF